MSKLLVPCVVIVLTMMLLDAIWIGGIARPLYDHGIGQAPFRQSFSVLSDVRNQRKQLCTRWVAGLKLTYRMKHQAASG